MKINVIAALEVPGNLVRYGGWNQALFNFSGEVEIEITPAVLGNMIKHGDLATTILGAGVRFNIYDEQKNIFVGQGRVESVQSDALRTLTAAGWTPDLEAFIYYQLEM